jgi:hypothetical protein
MKIAANAITILALLVSSVGQNSWDQRTIWMSGNKLAASCKHLQTCEDSATICTGRDSVEAGTCLGYIKGVSDAGSKNNICIPKGTTARQIVEIVIQRMAKNPELARNESGEMTMAADIIEDALRAQYPCPTSKP